jgi:hypothetical protein
MFAMRRLSIAAVLVVGSQLCGCGTFYEGDTETPKAPIERANFEELQSLGLLAVKPLSFASVKFAKGETELSEEEAFVGKDAEKRASWEADKKAMVAGFAEMMGTSAGAIQIVPMDGSEAAADAKYLLEPTVTVVDPGFFASLIIQSPSFAKVRFRILRLSDGAAVYQWEQTTFAGNAFASGTRMRAIASSVGMDAFRMIRSLQKDELASGTVARAGR